MAIKNILLHADETNPGQTRLEFAVQLAQSHGAHLTGLYLLPKWTVPAYVEGQIPLEVFKVQETRLRDAAGRTKQRFESSVKRAGLLAEWRQVVGNPVDQLILNARYTDLAVVGQPDNEMPDYIDLAYADKVALESGRPVLVVPSIGVRHTALDRILIAWNGSREAVRAINDALPILKRAKQVFVETIDPAQTGQEGHIPGADICQHLSRHGVVAEAESIQSAELAVGDVLLSRAADKSVDLIVMGAYGRSRFREIVLGGATRHLLEHMTVPVLFSH